MLTIQDQFIEETVKTDYKGNIENFIQEIKKLIRESKEKKLVEAYEKGDLSTGNIAKKLNITKYDVLELLEKYNIPYVNVDEKYLEQELKAVERISNKIKSK